MKKLKFLLLLFFAWMAFTLTGCQDASPTSQPPEPSGTTGAIPTVVQQPTAYPAPQESIPSSPTTQPLLLPEVVTQLTATQVVIPDELLSSTLISPLNPYPFPDSEVTMLPGSTPGPYPGPEQTSSFPSQTPQPGAPTATIAQGLSITATGIQGTPTTTSTFAPTPGLVQTELRATAPEDFILAAGGMQLVEFFAFWSPTSKSMAPVMYSLEQKYLGQILFSYLDIDNPANDLYKTLLGDRLPPVFFLLDGQGTVLAEFQGYVKPEEFEAAFVLPPLAPTQAPEPTQAPPPTP